MASTILPPDLSNFEADIKNNAPLLPQAHHEATPLLSVAEAELVSLDLELASKTPIICEGLREQHTENLAEIQLYKSAIAPHRRIPAEILSEIFTHCVDTVKVSINLHEAPWCLARVCSTWRQVVMRTPALWHDVQVDYQRNWSHPTLTSTANEILSRCGRLPVSIKIVGIFGNRDSTAFTQVLSDLVASRSTRLGSVVLKLDISYRAPFLRLPPGSLRFVDTVDLFFHVPIPESNITVFQNASRLRCVTLSNQRSYDFLSKLPCSSQLTHIFLREAPINVSEAHLILRHYTQLLECHFFICIKSGSQHEVVGDTQHLNLTSLILRSWSGLAEFVRGLVLPRLLNFEVFREVPNTKKPSEGINRSDGDWRDSYIPFLQGINNLQRLCVRQVIPDSIIEDVLRTVPTITILAIQDGDALPDPTLQLISQGHLIPKVVTICCFVVELNPFLDMLEARGLGPTPCPKFKKIFIDLDTNGGGAAYPSRQRVKALKVAGYNITLRG